MSRHQQGLTRRDFIRNAAGLTVAGAAGMSVLSQKGALAQAAPAKACKVVLVRDANVVDADWKVNAEIIQRMLDDAVKELAGESDVAAAWKRFIQPTDTVGIKTNLWENLRTPAELEAAIKRRVVETGVPENKVAVDDSGILGNPVFQQATALINTRPMRTHHWSGVGTLIKNYIVFSGKPSQWHDDSCANLAGIWDLPVCKGKTRLNILVMLTPLFHSKGPQDFNKKYTWEYKGLVVGSDPVACDATGLRILEAKRKEFFQADEPFAVSPKHIRVAEEKYHLGVADATRIEVKKLGWAEGILI